MAAAKTSAVPQYSQGQVTAGGVFAEIDTILARHRQKISLAISLPLQEKIQSILPALGIKNIPEEKQNQIFAEVAQETIRQTLEDVAKVQVPDQISIVLADSLTQTILNHPDLAGKIKEEDTKVFTKIVPHAQEVASQNQDILEKAAVLANLESIAKIQDQTAATNDLIAASAEQTVETEAPLTPPTQKEALKADLANYLKAYKEELVNQLKITADNIPTLKELQNVKENAHTQATQRMVSARPTQIGPKPAIQPPANLTDNLAQVLYLKPRQTPTALKLPMGGNLILTSPKRITEAYISLLSFDQEKLAKALKNTAAEIENYQKKKSLSYQEQLAYQETLKKHTRYVSAQAFHIKKPKRANAYRSLFARPYHGRVEVASQQAWIAENYFLPSLPKVVAHNQRLAAGAAFGSLGFSFAGVNFGSLFSKMRGQSLQNLTIGMGSAPIAPIKSVARKITGIAGAAAGGLLLYFASLGQAALAGALIGGGIGATTGAIAGAAIPVAMLGPAGVLLWPVTVPLGIATGGLVGIVAGGLIGLGIAAGSTTAISMGVGAGIGGVVGGYIGFGVGGSIGAGIGTGLTVITGGFAAPLIPVFTALGAAVGTAVGALIGSAIGAGIGYVIGNYIINPVVAFAEGAANAIAGLSIGIPSFSIGSFFTGLASTLWGGINIAAGGTLSLFTNGLNLIVSGLSSVSIPTGTALLLTAGPVAGVGITSILVITSTAASFATIATDTEIGAQKPGENQYFTIEKTAAPTKLDNADLPSDITFTIVLTVKDTNLENVSVTDQLKVQKEKESDSFTVTQDKNGNPISPIPCPPTIPAEGNCTYSFTITADNSYSDSIVNNIVKVTASPTGQPQVAGEDTASVIIGNPPTCFTPCGWPTTGKITLSRQTGHHVEAIDIANSLGTSLYATLTGHISLVVYNDCSQEELVAGECSSNERAGNFINISGGGFRILYAHMDTISVSQGSSVTCSQKVGTMGYTGWTDPDDVPLGSHLHYDFKEGGPILPPNIPETPSVGLQVNAPPTCIPSQ